MAITDLSVALRILEQVQKEARGLQWPPALAVRLELLHLACAADAAAEATERHGSLVSDDVLEVTLGLGEVHVLNGLSCLTSVLRDESNELTQSTASATRRRMISLPVVKAFDSNWIHNTTSSMLTLKWTRRYDPRALQAADQKTESNDYNTSINAKLDESRESHPQIISSPHAIFTPEFTESPINAAVLTLGGISRFSGVLHHGSSFTFVPDNPDDPIPKKSEEQQDDFRPIAKVGGAPPGMGAELRCSEVSATS